MPPKTMFEKIWDAHVVRQEPGKPALLYIDLHLVHEVTSPQAFEGLRLTGRTRPPAGPDDRHRRPQRADHGPLACRSPTRSRVKQIEALEPELRASSASRSTTCTAPGRASSTSSGRSWADPAGHDDRLRRQPHLHARRLRRARLRHRHVRGRARPGHADACCRTRPKTMEIRVDGALPPGVTAKDIILGIIGQIGIDGGDRLRDRVHRRGDPRLSMEGRMTVCNMSIEAGAPRRHDRAGRDDVRLPAGPPVRPAGRGVGRGGRPLAQLPTDAGATYDTRRRDRRRRAGAARHLGHQPRHGRAGHRPRARSRPTPAPRPSAAPPSGRWSTWG